MFKRLADIVPRYWPLVIVTWFVLVVALRFSAPAWNDVTEDGDFAFLPADMPSVVGDQLTRQAFPNHRAKSQVVLIVARDDRSLNRDDLRVADQLAMRFHNIFGVAALQRYITASQQASSLHREGRHKLADEYEQRAESAGESAQAAFDSAILLDERFAAAIHNRALLFKHIGLLDDFERDRRNAWRLDPALRELGGQSVPRGAATLPLVDVWSRHHELLGAKLRSDDGQAQLLVLQLSNEFMATENIGVMKFIEEQVEQVRLGVSRDGPSGLRLGVSGSAAVGGDMLSSAAESIKNTELFTIALVTLILLVVYRAPLLVTVPLITIAVSLSVSTSVLALLTQLDTVPGFHWWSLKVFTTTKIFIVVILFGAGTDFCLFLISRFREELEGCSDLKLAIGRALAGVSDALVASALTTILGLATMFFADFGKFSNSGPVIGICLFITLLACLTLAPALLRAFGDAVFWPFGAASRGASQQVSGGSRKGRQTPIWTWLSRCIVAYPGRILVVAVGLLSPLALTGYYTQDHVTFDLLSELDSSRASIQGSLILQQHFPIGEAGPLVVLAHREGAGFDDEQRKATAVAAIYDLTNALLMIDGVTAVRSLAEPLGDPPGRSLLRGGGLKKRVLREHRLTKEIFLAQSPKFQGDVTRLELVLEDDPFSKSAIETLERVDQRLEQERSRTNSFWHNASFAYTGTTAGIRDLRTVTRSDNRRIQILVVLAVFLVLLVILRQPMLCFYLILSVLFSYFVTIGTTELFFRAAYGDTFEGLDWKVPLFLFVILVAIGEDYNIYLVTRVLEEQQRHGPFAGLRNAIVRTGGIITSCGIIMAGTFVSMTSGTLRGIVELGFALSLGILLDTFVVRTVLVPAYLAIYCRMTAGVLLPSSRSVYLAAASVGQESRTFARQPNKPG